MTAVVFATEEEARAFLSTYKRGILEDLSEGEVARDGSLIFTITGIGKIKSTLRTERLLAGTKVHKLLHVGTCVALRKPLPVGTPFAISQVLEGDRLELTNPSYPRMPLEAPHPGYPVATLVSQDHLASASEEQTYWQRIADVADSNAYAIAYVAALHGVTCKVVKFVHAYINGTDAGFRSALPACDRQISDFIQGLLQKVPA